MPGEPRDQHVVTKSYLRQFAENGKLQRWEKTSGAIESKGLRKVCAELFFNTIHTSNGRNHELEDAWSDIERQVMPSIRHLAEGSVTQEDVEASKAFTAMHLARSYTVANISKSAFGKYALIRADNIETSAEWNKLFVEQYGRSPNPGERYDFALQQFNEYEHSNEFRAEVMVEQYEKFMTWLEPLRIQLVRSNGKQPAIGFITSDNPVAMWKESGLSIRLGYGLSTPDVEHIMLPLHPSMALLFTTRPEKHALVPPSVVQQINQFTWRNAHNFVFVHPQCDPHRSLPLRKSSTL